MSNHSTSNAGIALAGSAIVLVFVFFLASGFGSIFQEKKAFTRFSSSKQNLPINATTLKNEYAYYVGPADAKVTVTEFFDFQCPYSKQVIPVIEQLIDRYRGSSVKFVFRQLPITASHPFATSAALASLCAKDQNRFLEIYTTLFAAQDRIASNDFSEFARASGVSLPPFQECMSRKKYAGMVQKDISDASALPIQGTPTFFINETVIEGAESLEVFVDAIDDQLRS